VARCSNHAERFHGVINSRIKGCRTLTKRLRKIYLYINEKYDSYAKNDHNFRQFKHTIESLLSYKEDGG
jgi:hypothetical protein